MGHRLQAAGVCFGRILRLLFSSRLLSQTRLMHPSGSTGQWQRSWLAAYLQLVKWCQTVAEVEDWCEADESQAGMKTTNRDLSQDPEEIRGARSIEGSGSGSHNQHGLTKREAGVWLRAQTVYILANSCWMGRRLRRAWLQSNLPLEKSHQLTHMSCTKISKYINKKNRGKMKFLFKRGWSGERGLSSYKLASSQTCSSFSVLKTSSFLPQTF